MLPSLRAGNGNHCQLYKEPLTNEAANIIPVPDLGWSSQGQEKEAMFCVSHSSLQAGFPSGSQAASSDAGQDSLKLDLSHFTTCLMDKPSCTSLTLKKDTSRTTEGKEMLGPTPSTKGGA